MVTFIVIAIHITNNVPHLFNMFRHIGTSMWNCCVTCNDKQRLNCIVEYAWISFTSKHVMWCSLSPNSNDSSLSLQRPSWPWPLVVGFTTSYAISAYRHWCCEFESRSGRDVQYYVIKYVSDLRQGGGFLRVLQFPPPIKLTLNNINQSKLNHYQKRGIW